jgi:quercetin dioxygenase-like cupin family protein
MNDQTWARPLALPENQRKSSLKSVRPLKFDADNACSLGLHFRWLDGSPESYILKWLDTDLPAVNLAGWQVTFLELSFPGGVIAPSHRHPGFVLGYVLEGKYRFHVEGAPEAVLTVGHVFYEPPGCLHLPSGSVSATRPARVLALAFSKKGKELVTPP